MSDHPKTPTDQVRDQLLDMDVTLSDDASGCQYQGYEFGANYLDSVCIDGYLWDADSGHPTDDGWMHTSGGDIPCPHCNHAEWVDGAMDDAFHAGYQNDRPRDACPYNSGSRFDHLTEALRDAWLRGYDQGRDDD